MITNIYIWLYILIALAAILVLYIAKNASRVRVWIQVKQKSNAFINIGYLCLNDDGSAAEVHIAGGGKLPPIGQIIADGDKNRAYVKALTSNINDDSEKPKYVQCGYLVYDEQTEIDTNGYIYKKLKDNKEKTLVGYCARPSAPNVPTLEGERTWRTLWFVKTLCAYEGRPETGEKDKAKNDGKSKEQKNEDKDKKIESYVFNALSENKRSKKKKNNNSSNDENTLVSDVNPSSNNIQEELSEEYPIKESDEALTDLNKPTDETREPNDSTEASGTIETDEIVVEAPEVGDSNETIETSETAEVGEPIESVETSNAAEEDEPIESVEANEAAEVDELIGSIETSKAAEEITDEVELPKDELAEDGESSPEEESNKDNSANQEDEEKTQNQNPEDEQDNDKSNKKKDKKKKEEKVAVKQPIAICKIKGWRNYNSDAPAEARACAYALLAKNTRKLHNSEYIKDKPYGWKDTALLSSTIYTILFLILYIVNTGILHLPLLGNDLRAVGILIAAYYILWAIVRLIKIDCIENSNSFQDVLYIFNKNLGLKVFNCAIILFSLIALYLTYFYYDYDLMPMIWAIGFGVGVNMSITPANRLWRISTTYNDNDNNDEEEEETEPVNPPGDISRVYEWELDPCYSAQKLKGNLTLYFTYKDIYDERQCNPFFDQRTDVSRHEYILKMFNFLQEHKTFMARVKYIASYIRHTSIKNNLTPLDELQFALDFVQEPNIVFVQNVNCKEVNFYEDYIRYPDETLYDKQGDCNSKSLLAAMIFTCLDKNVLYLTSKKYNHAAIGIEVKNDELVNYGSPQKVGKITFTEQGKTFIFCETSGDKFNIGTTIEGMKLEEFNEKVLLTCDNNEIFEDEDEPIHARIYNWDIFPKDETATQESGTQKKNLHGNLTINIDESKIKELRRINPFKNYGLDGRTYADNIRFIFDYIFEVPERTEHVKSIAEYIIKRTQSLSELERIQFALSFVQEPNIVYRIDEECLSIDYCKEYMRFPDEVLFDKEGDCDCKSSLLTAIFHELGYNVIIMLSQKLEHAGIGVECSDELFNLLEPNIETEYVIREYNGTRYIYCETTGKGHRVGHIKDGDSIHDFDNIIEIES